MKRIILLSLAVLILFTGCGTKRLEDPAAIMKNLQHKYEKASTISVDMESEVKLQSNNVNFKGNTIIKAPNKYYSKQIVTSYTTDKKKPSIEMVVTSISDGKYLWDIKTTSKKDPIINKTPLTKDFFKDSINYSIFKNFDFKNNSFKLLRSEKLKGNYYYVIEQKGTTNRYLIWVNGDKWTVDKIEEFAEGSDLKPQEPVSTSTYSNYIFNGKLTDEKFNYTPPKGIKVNPSEYKS